MSKFAYKTINFQQKSLDLINYSNFVINEYKRQNELDGI